MSNSREETELRAKHGWAIEIVRGYFSKGLEQICAPEFLRKRYQEFIRKNDPIYTALLQGMDDIALEQTFVSYFTIFQTLATQSRFWLDDAIAQIVTEQAIRKERKATEVYSSLMLRNGYLKARRTVAEMGEVTTEHITNQRSWKEVVQKAALQKIDIMVGDEERVQPKNDESEPPKKNRSQSQILKENNRDVERMREVAAALTGPPGESVTLQCNLLLIEPEKSDGQPHAWAIRYINPKTFSQHNARKQERVNILRLYALLVQEKILRDPKSIHVCVAELMPRYTTNYRTDNYPDYFSTKTYWTSKELWNFIGVPFGVVQLAITDVGKEFKMQLNEGLRGLLPNNDPRRRLL